MERLLGQRLDPKTAHYHLHQLGNETLLLLLPSPVLDTCCLVVGTSELI